MNYLRYFQNSIYEQGKNDCWTFTQQLFKEIKNIELPSLPIIDDTSEGFLKTNIRHKRVEQAEEGCLIFVKTKECSHTGYAVNDKEYIHKGCKRVAISPIPKTAEIYEILK